MVTVDALVWREFGEEHLAELTGLAEACLAVDGGLPLFTTAPLLRARLLQTRTLGAWHDGRLVAAVSVGSDRQPATGTGLVHPAWRGRGLGGRLLSWAEEQAGDADLLLTTETWTPEADPLFTARGFERTFTEWVLRHALTTMPEVAPPDGVRTEPVTLDAELFETYRASFADRPGFVEPSAEDWLGELRDDDGYRPDLSMIARGADGSAVGFVNVIDNWIDQVGVVPGWRGRRVGAYLMGGALRGLAAGGAREAWLCVNDDNPAAGLYRRLGFRDAGRRARYLHRGTSPD
ncbi:MULTISPECIES: N-acetyltransferase [Micromonospora]|uniref:N-acetyltransferase n=1 Tax=Micromonospora solifontis TaxID=2487138 RepID=A0ABX9WPQ5_9ACTN|nr:MULTISPECIES: N-acetyltransferase [Micromonospora]NES13200.1 GNAT family N-acetyltransferase [Micromonospora sp. PPF5-17B]NES34569.1 GNAT family N-acetyltransferase [Micromonospora solifontis]NES57067.1 GNAT family N-acetyltransferase [Micromonospora sp. PPF5-6]RNM01824.1 N-acetyltransferase [Micromonospora solifontis]